MFRRKARRGNRLLSQPTLTLSGASIPIVSENKFLGLIFDDYLCSTYCPPEGCFSGFSTCIINAKSWRDDRRSLFPLHFALVLSKLYYGSVVYGQSSASLLRTHDPVENADLIIAIDAFRYSSLVSLEVKAIVLSLSLRRERSMCFAFL